MAIWNPWHGCRKISAGCAHCYVYRMDARYDRDSSRVALTGNFGLPLKRRRTGEYAIPPGETVYTCFTSDFFLEEADPWRQEAWSMMAVRTDLSFFIITKRIERLEAHLPPDWGVGYPHVSLGCTVENQDRADYRLPIFLAAPIAHRYIISEPLLESIDLGRYLGPWIEEVVVGGESGKDARLCDYDWVLDIRDQCVRAQVPFHFKQTGARFRKDGKVYFVPRRIQSSQARRAAIDFSPTAPEG